MRLSTIICEGVYDRAFWHGWLERVGIVSPPRSEWKTFQESVNKRGYTSTKSEYALKTPAGDFVGLRPVDGQPNILPTVRSLLRERTRSGLGRIIVNLDPDTIEGSTTTGLRVDDLLREAKPFDSGAEKVSESEISLEGGAASILLVRWEVPEVAHGSIPEKQTLERLVCTALHMTYPERAENVAAWLGMRHSPTVTEPKTFAWSYMAGWFADSACEDFFRALWRDEQVAAALERLLRDGGQWQVVESLL